MPREDETWEHCTLCIFKFQACNREVLWLVCVMKVTQSCPTLCDPMDYRVPGILQARIVEWVVVPFSRGSSQPRDRPQDSLPAEPPGKPACSQEDTHQASPISTCFRLQPLPVVMVVLRGRSVVCCCISQLWRLSSPGQVTGQRGHPVTR